MSLAYKITKSLKGDWYGSYGLISGPNHSSKDRSLKIQDKDGDNTDVIVHSFAGQSWKECREYIESKRLLLDKPHNASSQSRVVSKNNTKNDKINFAIEVWKQCVPAPNTLVEVYLRSRDLKLPQDTPIGFHAHCPMGDKRLPAMVGLMTDIRTSIPCGIHRTYLKADGSGKAEISPNKMMLGVAKNAVIRLSDNTKITTRLGIVEGIENGLTILNLGWSPVWVVLSSGGMQDFPVIHCVDTLTIFVDHDKTGQKAAEKCADIWSCSGKEVVIRTPSQYGSDWNDCLREVL